MSKFFRIMIVGMLVLVMPGVARAAAGEDVATLKKQISELQGQVADLEKKLAETTSPQADPDYETWDPFAEMRALQRQMDALMGVPLSGYQPLARRGSNGFGAPVPFHLDYDIHETDKAYLITFDMPGMEKSKINVEVKEGALLISGERSSESQESKANKIYRQQRSFGYFSRVIPLPKNARPETVQAKYDNGVLTVTVEKKEAEKSGTPASKKIDVK